jgi:2-oxoglutarate dehydrogenase E2 component (dihydrolipoamide succinyltransferase)
MADIAMPQLGETVTEGTITKWFKAVGDQVTEDEPLFEVSTDKVDSEVPSPASGYLVEIRVAEGDTVDVGTVLAVISDSPAQAASGDSPGDAAAPAAAPAEEPAPAAPAVAGAGSAAAPSDPSPEPEPDLEPSPEPPPAPVSSGAGDGVVLSPIVRRLIAEHDLDPSTIEGTGEGGRITRADVLRAAEGRGPTPAPASKGAPAPRLAPMAPATAGERDTVVPLNNIRRRTGEHMVRSKATSPHVLTVMEVDFEGVERARRAVRDEFREQEGFSLTYLPFVTRALVDAIAEFPHMNASVGDGELIVHHDVNVGIAVDLNYEGLIVPVIHDAQDKRLRAIARDISDLAQRARAKQLSADDISGGTVTITNAGQWGTFVQMVVINQPQVMILSTEGVTRRPVVVTDASGNEAIAIHSVGNLSMAWDHRAFDGAYAAAFLRRVCEILETRDWSAEL